MSDPKSTYMPDYAVGDSIAHMFMELGIVKAVDPAPAARKDEYSREDRYTKIGLQSADVLKRVERLASEVDLKDKRVVLSSGLSNIIIDKERHREPDFESIKQQLDILQQSGAKVTLIGVSNENTVLSQYNAKLEEMAKQHGATFARLPETHAGDLNMHPGYWALVDNVQNANAGDHSIPELNRNDAAQVKDLFRKVNAQGKEHYDLTSPYHDGAHGVTIGVTGEALHAFEQKHGLNSPDKDALIKALNEAAGETQSSTPTGVPAPQTPARPARPGSKMQASGG